MPRTHRQLARGDPLKPLYDRLYARTDLRGSGLHLRLVLVVGVVWLLCGVLNFAVLGRAFLQPRERAVLAFGYGPAFVPLGLMQPRSTVAIVGKRVPVRAGAHLLGGSVLLLCLLPFLLGGEQSQHRARWQRLARKHAARQGRLPLRQIRNQLRLAGPGLPLAIVEGEVIGMPYGADRGHVAVIAPTRSGKGLHLTETLLRWPGAAVVLDPKGEQWTRTAGTRMELGPVYRLPEQGIDLADAFRLHDPLDVQELHANLLRTWKDREPIFGEKSLSLLHAAITSGLATDEHPLRVLARWVDQAASVALCDGLLHARSRVLQFTDGDDPATDLNRFAQSAWGTLTTRMAPLVPHIPTVTCSEVPRDWPARNATIYLCYPLDQLPTAGPLISCIVAACIKTVMRQPRRTPTLFALDEVPATALAKLDAYITTLGSYGGTFVLYLQSISQLDDVYGAAKAQTILGNCHTKVYYPPRDQATAEHLSKAFGTELRFVRSDSRSSGSGGGSGLSMSRAHTPRGPQTSQSWSEKETPVLGPAEVDALPEDAVLVLTQGATQLRVLAERLNPIPLLPDLPAPPAVRRSTGAPVRPTRGRVYAGRNGYGGATRWDWSTTGHTGV